jgi:hypothetical protein
MAVNQYNRTPPRAVLTKSDGSDFVVTLTAYAANDCVGGLGRVWYGTNGGALLLSITIQDNAVQNEPYIVHLFSTTPTTTIANDAAMALVAADGNVKIGEVTIGAGDYVTENGGDYSKAFVPVATEDGLIDESSDGYIYVYLQCTDTPDYAAVDDLRLEFVFWTD